jgi:N utilization substance protein B
MTTQSIAGARTRARELLLQALYQKQIAGHDLAELKRQFHEQTAWQRVDQDYFDEALTAICGGERALLDTVGKVADRPVGQLDPVEFAILQIGVYELTGRMDVPYRVVINEAVNLARRFGAEDGHKYVNACLDRAAQTLRPIEIKAKGSG